MYVIDISTSYERPGFDWDLTYTRIPCIEIIMIIIYLILDKKSHLALRIY
jgi:hypothetical protein